MFGKSQAKCVKLKRLESINVCHFNQINVSWLDYEFVANLSLDDVYAKTVKIPISWNFSFFLLNVLIFLYFIFSGTKLD